MQKIVYTIFIIMLFVTCSMFFVSCEAITAQNININSNSGVNGFPWMGRLGVNYGQGPRMNDKSDINANKRMH
jgi:hypothetical protein